MERLPTRTRDQGPGTRNQLGVALIEILIAVTVGGILIVAAALLITTTLRLSGQNKFLQAASFLSQDLMDKVTVYAETKWFCPPAPNCLKGANPAQYGIYNLLKGDSDTSRYYINTAVSPFEWALGKETKSLDGVPYERYFYLENVYRDSGGNIESGFNPANEDPSTQKVTVVTAWPQGGEVRMVKFLTRHTNKVFVQTDWSLGAKGPNVFSAEAAINEFDNASNIDFLGEPGKIKIKAN